MFCGDRGLCQIVLWLVYVLWLDSLYSFANCNWDILWLRHPYTHLYKFLQERVSVKLKGIGVFGVWVTSKGYYKPKDINPKKVRASKVTFRPDRGLVKSIKEMKFDNMPKLPKGLVTKKG
jgi:hypothetical protein